MFLNSHPSDVIVFFLFCFVLFCFVISGWSCDYYIGLRIKLCDLLPTNHVMVTKLLNKDNDIMQWLS